MTEAREEPFLGYGNAWYDTVYKVVSAIDSKIPSAMPANAYVRGMLDRIIKFLMVLSDHRRHVLDRDPEHWYSNIAIEPGESVTMPTLWVVDFFPPSRMERLDKVIRNQGWSRSLNRWGADPTSEELLKSYRKSDSGGWWGIADIVPSNSTSQERRLARERLPAEFERVELSGLHITSSLTAVLAKFTLAGDASVRLDRIWRGQHRPKYTWRRHHGLRALSRKDVALRDTSATRFKIHDSARRWLSDRVPGELSIDQTQLVVDLLLLTKHDPSVDRNPELGKVGALSALGVDPRPPYHYQFTSQPGLMLGQGDTDSRITTTTGQHWYVWGQRDAVFAGDKGALDDESTVKNLANQLHWSLGGLLLSLGISRLLDQKTQQYADLRDAVGSTHARMKLRRLKSLRRTFLTLSFDMTNLRRDLHALNDKDFFPFGEARIVQTSWRETDPTERSQGVDFNRLVRRWQIQKIDSLHAIDTDYRTILSTVVGLGSSISTIRLARVSLVTALVSAFLAGTTIALTKVDPTALLPQVWNAVETYWQSVGI